MLHRRNFDKKTGIYRSSDSIDNFRFRITLKTLNSFVKVPKFNADQLAENDELDEIEYEDFYWQQKRFNANELEQFRNADNCKTDTHKRYHQQILNELADRDENDPNNCRIFSYVMDDKFKPPKMELDESSDAQLVENVESYGDWHEAGGRGKILADSDDENQIGRLRYKNLGKFDTMYIMAELEKEIILATIKYRANDGLLIIYPDFNSIETNPYFKEIDSDSKHIYQYAIENLCDERRQPDWSFRDDMDKLASKLSDLSVKSSAVFAVPPRHSTQVCLCLEIESAAQFSYDHIHVKFRFIIPDKCNVIDGDVEGSTQSSYRQRSGSGTWLIGFCHELNILCNHEYQFNDHPKIMFEVVSIDWWGRERTEGYAMATIPLLAGRDDESVSFYRDLGDDTWYEWLERYFIGGRKKVLLDEFYANSTEKKPMLNRYGNKTQTTGMLRIKWNVIMQRDSGGINRHNIKNSGKHRQGNRRQAAITSVLDAYREARGRLEEIIKP